jgi:site-specific recombinase XerD
MLLCMGNQVSRYQVEVAAAGVHAALVVQWLEVALPAAVALGELTEGSIRPYRQAVTRWLQYLAGSDLPTPANVKEWVATMRASGLSHASVGTYLAGIKSCYRYLESQDSYPNIARAVRSPRARNDTPLPCPSGEIVAEMFRSIPSDAIQGLRNRALLAVMYSTALRCVSLLRALVEDVDFGAGTLRHQPKGHREKDAIAVLSTTASTALAEYIAARGPLTKTAPLFAPVGNRRSASGHLSTRSMRAVVLSLSEIAGLARRSNDGKLLNPGHFSAHAIRRAAVTVAVETLGLESGQVLAGHSSAEVTKRSYARVDKYRQLQATAKALDF